MDNIKNKVGESPAVPETLDREFADKLKRSQEITLKRKQVIEDARVAYKNEIPDSEAKKLLTKSKYMSSDFHNVIKNLAEFVTENLPTFQFANGKTGDKKSKKTIDKAIKQVITLNSLNFKFIKFLESSLINGFACGELIYKPIKESCLVYMADGSTVSKDLPEKAALDLIIYDPLDVYIDPTADPLNINGTAEFIIVKKGVYTKQTLFEYFYENNITVNADFFDKIVPINYNQIQNSKKTNLMTREGINTGTTIEPLYSLHFEYSKSGYKKYIVNEAHIAGQVLNNKMCKRMPLIVFTPYPSENTPYGITLYEITKNQQIAKDTIINITLDAALKNLTAITFTSSQSAVQRLASGNIPPNAMISVEDALDNNIHNMFFRPQIPDFTQGLNVALQSIEQDARMSNPLSSVSMGEQNTQIRTNSVLNELRSKTQRSINSLLTNIEINMFQQLGKDILQILVTYFHKFDFAEQEISQDELLEAMSSIRIKNGSSLSEDRTSRLEAINMLIQEVMATQSTSMFKILDLFKEKYELLGLDDFDDFLEDNQTIEAKMTAEQGLPIELSKNAMNLLR